jgi:two-component system chemotaxis response regulator CheY
MYKVLCRETGASIPRVASVPIRALMPSCGRSVGMTHRVLVVDDSSFQRTVIRDALEGSFDVVGEAEHGAEAVELFEAYEPDAVSMDVVMPEMTGIEATRAIKARWPDTVIVMCTSVDQQEKMMEAVKAGADGYVTKPVDADELVPELQRQLG